MWKHYITFFYILITITCITCCDCNHSDFSIEKRQLLEPEEITATEYIDNTTETDTKETTLELSTSSPQYQTTFLDINETTTVSYESIIKITEIETNESQTTPDVNNTFEILLDISENSSEAMETMTTEPVNTNKYGSEFLNANETTDATTGADGVTERKETENLSQKGETVDQSEDDLRKKCRHYKNGNSFKLDKMVDVWQVVYYRLPSKMKCFAINIKEVKLMEQQRYAKQYGSFNDRVDWERCFLEITSIETVPSGRRHFLQGGESDMGAMANVIIDEEVFDNSTYLTLHSEGGDQWLVINNILLMRDCDTGDFVVFTKYRNQPKKSEVMIALRKFGEANPGGTVGCNLEKKFLSLEEEIHENRDNNEHHSVQSREEMQYNKNTTSEVNTEGVSGVTEL